MKITFAIVLLMVGTITCQRRPVDTDSSSDTRGRGSSSNSGSGRQRPSSGSFDEGSDSSGRGSGSRGRARLPDFYRIEVEVQRLENSAGILADGKTCDFTGACDPVIQAFLDVESPLSPWPGSNAVFKKWPTIFQVNNQNSPTIAKSVNRDVCGGASNKVNLRVYVSESDAASRNDLIGNFECVFSIDPQDVSGDALSAQWGTSTECKGLAQPGKIRLFARQRTYQIASTSCSANGSTGSSGSRLQSELSASAGAHVAGQHDFIRIDTEIVQLLNPQGLLATKKPCDSTSKCDPQLTVFLDTDKPLAAWPGSKTVPEYTTLFEVSNTDSPIVNMNVSKNICGGSVGKVNLRVHVVDVNTLTANNLIEDFECLFDADYRLVARSVSSAEWTSTQDCKPQHAGNDIRLQYRYRLYDISPADCGIKSGIAKAG